jgi:sensor c-di-GMP phosphodiesterase-like protein
MRGSTAEIERQAKAILDSVESGVELIEERARPFVERHRVTIVAVGLGALVGVSAAVMIARMRRRRTLVMRLHDATTSVGDRLERPLSTIKSAAERIAR